VFALHDDIESIGGYESRGVSIPCTCGEVFHQKSAFHGHHGTCDGDLDTTREGRVRVGLAKSLDEIRSQQREATGTEA
jgi:hypothetical protein